MSIWDRIRNLFSKKDSKQRKNGEHDATFTKTPKNGTERAPHPYDQVDVNEHGAEVKTEPNEFQIPRQKGQRQYEEVDIPPEGASGGVGLH